MKKLFENIKKIFFNIFNQLKDRTNIIIFIIVVLVVSCEVWVPFLIGLITQNAWWFGIATACWAFWLAPFTPFIFICIGLTILIRKILDKIQNKKSKTNQEENSEDKK